MPTKIVVPEMGESVVEATVTRWLKQEGDAVAIGDVLLELETEKVNLEVGSNHAGVLVKIEKPAGSDVRVGDVLGYIEEGASAAAKGGEQASKPSIASTSAAPGIDTGIDMTEQEQRHPAETTPSGIQEPQTAPAGKPEGIYATRPAVPPTPPPEPEPPLRPAPPPAAARPQPAIPEKHAEEEEEPLSRPAPTESKLVERQRMSRRRRTIARNLIEAQQTTATLTTFNEVDMSAVMEIRNRHKESFKKAHGVSLGITSFFVKAVIGALKQFPKFNAEIQGDDVIYKHFHDIGVAIDTPEGLIVPVLRDADRMTFAQIEQAIKTFVDKSRDGTLSLEDLRGGCFTITNGGIFGSLLSTPILNMPQVAILGLHRIEDRPIALNGQVVIHPMMYVALSYDHRLIDGRDAVTFLKYIKELIEDPGALLLEAH